ncbi:hypothetical protein ACIRL3_46465 [Streptomyces sp. NPDC102384]|uniref:hypothetical protein n=1 Tax=Streptomyces sp. NPDC102384 TaxID=3366166 RepID=UPI00382931A6
MRTCRRELPDRTLPRNEHHLRHTLHELEHHYNENRPHCTLQAAALLRALPNPITTPDRLTQLDIHRIDLLGGTLHEYRHVA